MNSADLKDLPLPPTEILEWVEDGQRWRVIPADGKIVLQQHEVAHWNTVNVFTRREARFFMIGAIREYLDTFDAHEYSSSKAILAQYALKAWVDWKPGIRKGEGS